MKKLVIRVRLEPELEEVACLWTIAKRRRMATKLARWARQLSVSAAILEADQQSQKPRPVLQGLARRRLLLN